MFNLLIKRTLVTCSKINSQNISKAVINSNKLVKKLSKSLEINNNSDNKDEDED